jgi:Putative prokaryotic signal transducing protein
LRELLRTNNLVLLSRLTALLAEEGIEAVIFDAHSSSIMGDSVGLMQRRLMVAEEDFDEAERIRDALGEPMPRD